MARLQLRNHLWNCTASDGAAGPAESSSSWSHSSPILSSPRDGFCFMALGHLKISVSGQGGDDWSLLISLNGHRQEMKVWKTVGWFAEVDKASQKSRCSPSPTCELLLLDNDFSFFFHRAPEFQVHWLGSYSSVLTSKNWFPYPDISTALQILPR